MATELWDVSMSEDGGQRTESRKQLFHNMHGKPSRPVGDARTSYVVDAVEVNTGFPADCLEASLPSCFRKKAAQLTAPSRMRRYLIHYKRISNSEKRTSKF